MTEHEKNQRILADEPDFAKTLGVYFICAISIGIIGASVVLVVHWCFR